MADRKKPGNNKEYFKAEYVRQERIRSELWQTKYYDQMKSHPEFRNTVDKRIKEGPTSKHKQEADFLWKCVLTPAQKDNIREFLKMDDYEPENTTQQVEGQPSVKPPSYPAAVFGNEKKDNKLLIGDHKEQIKILAPIIEPGDDTTEEKPYCPNNNCAEYMTFYKIGSKFCVQCAAPLNKLEPMENILEKNIPELAQTVIIQNPDEKQIFQFSINDLYHGQQGKLQCVVAPYDNPDGSNYMQLLCVSHPKINCIQLTDCTKICDILVNLIKHNIFDPICRTGVFLKSDKNWWNKRIVDNALISFRYAHEITEINDGIQIHENAVFEDQRRQQNDDNVCTFVNKGFSNEDKIFRKVLSQIKEDLFYSPTYEKIYTFNNLQNIFDIEDRIIENFIIKEHSKHIKISGYVNIFILNDEMDALIELSDQRKRYQRIACFKFKMDIKTASMLLSGMMKL
jgi:hypothetical protein